MHAKKLVLVVSVALAGLSLALSAGCDLNLNLPDDWVARLEAAVSVVQTEDPRDVDLPQVLDDQGDTVIIDQSVNVIVNIEQDLVVEELPDQTVLGFDNQTGFDIYIKYYADDELQGVYVFDGETLLLDYNCLDSIELVSEDDIEPATGLLDGSFDLTNGLYLNPDDFFCGEALILTFDPFEIQATVESIDLVD